MIDRAFTKAEARYIPNGAAQHGRHGAPDPHRRPRRLLLPAVPVRRGDAGHADRALGVLRPARLRARRAGPRSPTRTCARRSSPAAPRSSAARRDDVRSIDLAPTAAFLLGIPEPQQSQGVVRRDLLEDGARRTRRSRSSGSTTSTVSSTQTTTHDRRPRPSTSAARAQLATMFDEEAAALPGPTLLLAGGRQRRRVAAELGAAGGHADDRRRERVGARRDELRQPRVRLRRRAHPRARGARELPVPVDQHRRRGHRPGARLGQAVDGLPRQRRHASA